MKTMIATFGICLAMAVAGCAQKADTNTTLAAFDDSPSSCCASTCATKTASAGCPMTTKTAAASTCSKTAASSGCCASKKMMTTKSDTVSN